MKVGFAAGFFVAPDGRSSSESDPAAAATFGWGFAAAGAVVGAAFASEVGPFGAAAGFDGFLEAESLSSSLSDAGFAGFGATFGTGGSTAEGFVLCTFESSSESDDDADVAFFATAAGVVVVAADGFAEGAGAAGAGVAVGGAAAEGFFGASSSESESDPFDGFDAAAGFCAGLGPAAAAVSTGGFSFCGSTSWAAAAADDGFAFL